VRDFWNSWNVVGVTSDLRGSSVLRKKKNFLIAPSSYDSGFKREEEWMSVMKHQWVGKQTQRSLKDNPDKVG